VLELKTKVARTSNTQVLDTSPSGLKVKVVRASNTQVADAGPLGLKAKVVRASNTGYGRWSLRIKG
jgi:hypothetical protein